MSRWTTTLPIRSGSATWHSTNEFSSLSNQAHGYGLQEIDK